MRRDRMAAEESFTQRYAAAQAAAVVERLATLTALVERCREPRWLATQETMAVAAFGGILEDVDRSIALLQTLGAPPP